MRKKWFLFPCQLYIPPLTVCIHTCVWESMRAKVYSCVYVCSYVYVRKCVPVYFTQYHVLLSLNKEVFGIHLFPLLTFAGSGVLGNISQLWFVLRFFLWLEGHFYDTTAWHIISWLTLALISWLLEWLPSLSCLKGLTFPFAILAHRKEVTVKNEDFHFIFLRVEYLHYLFRIFFCRRFVSFSFTYLQIQYLFQCGLMEIWNISYTFEYQPIALYLLLKDCFIFGHWKFV